MNYLRLASTYTSTIFLTACWILTFGVIINSGHAQELASLGNAKAIESTKAESTPSDLKNWLMVPYDTENLSGQLMGESVVTDAKDIRLPLNHQGWFTVVLGVWNPEPAYAPEPAIKARLSSENKTRWVRFGPRLVPSERTYLEEVTFCSADLTNETAIYLGRAVGLQPRSAYVAYVNLIPLSDTKVQEIIASSKNKYEIQNLTSRVVAPIIPSAAR